MKNIEKCPSPSFIVDKMTLNENIKNIKDGCKILKNNVIIGYSVKTNSLPFLIKYFNKNDLYTEVVSSDEYQYVKKLGIKNNRIIYNGPLKSKKTFINSVKLNSITNVETFQELEWLLNDKIFNKQIGIRINLPIQKEIRDKFEYPTEGSRFGFDINDIKLKKYIEKLKKDKNIIVNGLHFHLNTKDRTELVYKYMLEYASKVVSSLNLNLEYIDLGGGYLGGKENDFKRYTSIIKNSISRFPQFENLSIIIEPGASLVATAISYITRVTDVKIINSKNFVTIDGSRIHVDPTFSDKKYNYKSNCHILSNYKTIICGFSCMERDRIVLDNNLNFKPGDYIIFKNMGAYTITFIPNFICSYPKVYLYNNKFILIKKKKKLNVYLR